MKMIHTCMVLSLVGALGSAPVAAHQKPQQPPADHAKQQAPEPVTGEVLAVDDNAKTIVVKASGDTEIKFSYSGETEIVGGEKGPAGLATSAGTIVTVTYGVHGTTNVAVRIEVKPKVKS